LSIITFFTLLVAIGGLWVTYNESRRNNRPIIKILDCSYSFRIDIEDGYTKDGKERAKGVYNVRILNCGINLFNPNLKLVVTNFDKTLNFGTMSIMIKRNENKTWRCEPIFQRNDS
jgi:hypothetical protein